MKTRKRAVVTGATKGIGRATAELLWANGYDLAVCARSESDLQEMHSKLSPLRPEQKLIICACDLANDAGVSAFAKACSMWEHLELLVNNAGQFLPGRLIDGDGSDLKQLWQLNVMSVLSLTLRLLPSLKSADSVSDIVNVSSIAGLAPYPPGGAYAVSKFGLRGLSTVLRDELKNEHVRVTTVYPGAAMSASWEGVDIDPSRIMKAEDVAEAIVGVTRMSRNAVVEEIVLRPLKGDLPYE